MPFSPSAFVWCSKPMRHERLIKYYHSLPWRGFMSFSELSWGWISRLDWISGNIFNILAETVTFLIQAIDDVENWSMTVHGGSISCHATKKIKSRKTLQWIFDPKFCFATIWWKSEISIEKTNLKSVFYWFSLFNLTPVNLTTQPHEKHQHLTIPRWNRHFLMNKCIH